MFANYFSPKRFYLLTRNTVIINTYQILIATGVVSTLVQIVATLFWGILAPFCWVVSYFRLREFEA